MAEGRLLVCATPIGNLGDVTLRVLDALRAADVIEAEDTRVTRKLLARYEISTLLEPYHAKNLERRTPEVVDRVAAGQTVALVSDAGTPGVSDPGAHLVDSCIDAGLTVEVLPGASAIVTALVASGLPTHAFYFGGFLPRKVGDRRRALEKLATLDATLVFYESPRRAAATVASVAEVMPGREAAMARELTKIHEEVSRARGRRARGRARGPRAQGRGRAARRPSRTRVRAGPHAAGRRAAARPSGRAGGVRVVEEGRGARGLGAHRSGAQRRLRRSGPSLIACAPG